jgi:hypothetical protein
LLVPNHGESGGWETLAQQVKRFKHKIVCDCGAELEMTVVITYEEGSIGGTSQKSVEGEKFWQHMLHCVGE